MFCRQPSTVDGCADPPHRMGALSGANDVSARSSRPKATINYNICRTFPIFVE